MPKAGEIDVKVFMEQKQAENRYYREWSKEKTKMI